VHIVSVINYKGGVGKTTVTTNLGGELAFRGHKVLMIDLDPQASLTFSFLRPEDWQKSFAPSKTIKNWYDSLLEGKDFPITDLIYEPRRAKSYLRGKGTLQLISSHLGLINVDLELATLLGGASLKQTKQNFLKVHRRLAEGINQIPKDDFDIILIDCPPNFNIVTKTAIVASNFILVPTRPDYLSTLGIDYLIKNVRELVDNYNDFAKEETGEKIPKIKPANLGVVFNMVQEMNGGPIKSQDSYVQQITAQSGLYVFDNYIKRNDTLFAHAPETGVPVVLNGYTPGTYKNVVDGLEEVATEFKKRVGLK